MFACGVLFYLSCTPDLITASAEGSVEEDPSKYIVIDGIKVLREDYEAFAKAEEKIKNQKIDGGSEASELQREYELERQEDAAYSERFPKRCHG